MIIIGITGKSGSGKGTVAQYFIEKGFKHYSVSGYLTQELKKHKQVVNRDTLIAYANKLRKKYGGGYIVEELVKNAKVTNSNCVIESIRNLAEISSLKNIGYFYLINVSADSKVRYERTVNRGGVKDKVTFAKFMGQEKKEARAKNEHEQELDKCIQKADFIIDNNRTTRELFGQIEAVLEKILYTRPTWDEYFLEISEVVGKRSTCNRGRTSCVIARDKQLLVTGYSGAPAGLPHCDEVGHLLKKTVHENGEVTEHCVRTVHAEQNAICQAAKLGISINGGTIYVLMTPCRTCAMLIINCGIKRVYCAKRYHTAGETEEMFKTAGVELVYKSTDVLKY